jgi:hypothetical protein
MRNCAVCGGVAGEEGMEDEPNCFLGWLRMKGAVPMVWFNKVEGIDEACEVRGKSLTRK